IVVGLERLDQRDGRVQLRFTVRDTGIGMSEEQQARLFESFSQADSTIARRYGGTGLGLAICKRLIELMEGEISVTSRPGEGSCFSFTAWFGEPTHKAEPLDLHRIRGVRTLVVDCQPTGRLILQQLLQRWRFQVATAAFGDEALYKLRRAERNAPFELILLDWKTVGSDFVEQARKIAAERSSQPLAILASVNLRGSDRVHEALREHAVNAILTKPVTPSRLFEAIVELQHGDVPPHQHSAPRQSDWAEILLPIRGARVLLAEDNPVNQQIAIAFLTIGGLDVTVANTGVEAVDRVKTESFDAVLMDLQMPEMDGIPATKLIRALPQGSSLPIIAMTAAVLDADKQECLAAGMNAHVTKPIDPQELIRNLLAWIPPKATGNDRAGDYGPRDSKGGVS
ncbi:MAG TPA: response regulator, partial [Burkholderiaceae bacterium]